MFWLLEGHKNMKYNYKDFDGNLYDDMKNCEIAYKEYLKNLMTKMNIRN